MVAGLRQLDRLALSLNEFAVQHKQTAPMSVCLLWSRNLDRSQRWLPKDGRLTTVAFTGEIEEPCFDLILSTRLFLYRNALPQLMEVAVLPPEIISGPSDECWETCSRSLESLPRSRDGAWEYIVDGRQIDDIERKFLRGSGKSQDGVVSRYLNRPISRTVTRLLLRFPTTPNAWTLLIFPIPVAASLLLLGGTYWSFLWGFLLFQVFSILDGCDGEIARAKFLESERGRRLDGLCDILSNILLVAGLGLGLFRQSSLAGHSGWFYLSEGLVAAALIGVNEFLLARREQDAGGEKSGSLGGALYPRHRELVERSGMLFLGEKFAAWLIQLTKHDVALLFFLFLAAFGQSAWILHLLFGVGAISLTLVVKSFSRGSVPPSET